MIKKVVNKLKRKYTHLKRKYIHLKLYNAIVNKKWEGKENYKKEIAYIKAKKRLCVFPYDFSDKYKSDQQDAVLDAVQDVCYVMNNGKRLYFPGHCLSWVTSKYANLRREQDEQSPHCYFTKDFYPNEDEIFVDIGCAEGKEALEVVDRVKQEYLFECSEVWEKPLNNTFKNYMEKTHIFKYMVGNINKNNCVTLDSFFKNSHHEKYFIKMDVEGSELSVLEGAKDILQKGKIRMAVTTYHRMGDEDKIAEYLEKRGFKIEFSSGYMLFLYDSMGLKPPYFRRGVIRASNY